jgi:hypothetical protein
MAGCSSPWQRTCHESQACFQWVSRSKRVNGVVRAVCRCKNHYRRLTVAADFSCRLEDELCSVWVSHLVLHVHHDRTAIERGDPIAAGMVASLKHLATIAIIAPKPAASGGAAVAIAGSTIDCKFAHFERRGLPSRALTRYFGVNLAPTHVLPPGASRRVHPPYGAGFCARRYPTSLPPQTRNRRRKQPLAERHDLVAVVQN